MTGLFRDPQAGWAALIIVLLPLVIIGAGELEERLRQRESDLRRPVSILRIWVVPLFTAWALVRVLFDVDDDGALVRILTSALILSGAAAVLGLVAAFTRRLGDRPRDGVRRALPRLVLALPRLGVVLVTAWLLVDTVWAVDLSNALTAFGVTSLVISFALQGTLSGLASGFLLLFDRPFQPGDWIRSGDIEGRVVDMNWRSSRIENRDLDLVIVPNSQLAGATIVNFDEPTRLHRIVVSLQVAFVNPPTAAKEMLLAAARATPGVLAEPPPEARVVQIDDPLMGYDVHLWVEDYSIVPKVKSDFGSLVWYHSHRTGVPLPSPAQDLYLFDGVQAALEGRLDHPELVRRLRGSALLAELGDDALDQLASAATGARFAAGEVILVEGSGRALQLLHRGTASLVARRAGRDDLRVLDLGPGDLFGVLDGAAAGDHSRLVVAGSDCEVVVVGGEVAADVISRAPELARAIDQLASVRRRRVERALRAPGHGPGQLAPGEQR